MAGNELVLSRIEYMGNYELMVITDTKHEGRRLITEYIETDGLDLAYYDTVKLFVEDTLVQETLTKGTVHLT